MDEADAAAATRRSGADQYARETLFDIEERLASQLAPGAQGDRLSWRGRRRQNPGLTPSNPH